MNRGDTLVACNSSQLVSPMWRRLHNAVVGALWVPNRVDCPVEITCELFSRDLSVNVRTIENQRFSSSCSQHAIQNGADILIDFLEPSLNLKSSFRVRLLLTFKR